MKASKAQMRHFLAIAFFVLFSASIVLVLSRSCGDPEQKGAIVEASQNSSSEQVQTPSPLRALELESNTPAGDVSLASDVDALLRDLLDKEHCYSLNGEAVMENPNAGGQEAFDRAVREQKRRMAKIAQSLTRSNDAEHLFAAAILSKWHEGSPEFYDKANSIEPDNRVYRFHHAVHCLDDAAACNTEYVLQELIRVDGDNSQAYLLRASNNYESGRVDLALEDLRYAATLPRTDTYFADLVLIMERAHSAAGAGFSESAQAAFGLAASNGVSYSTLSQMCIEMSKQDNDWRDTCINYLERVESQSLTELDFAVAVEILNAVVQSGPESSRQKAVEGRYAAYRQRRDARLRATIDSDFDNEFYLFESPRLFNDYLNHMKAHGELSAQRFYDEEVDRLKSNGWLSPCEIKRRTEASAD